MFESCTFENNYYNVISYKFRDGMIHPIIVYTFIDCMLLGTDDLERQQCTYIPWYHIFRGNGNCDVTIHSHTLKT